MAYTIGHLTRNTSGGFDKVLALLHPKSMIRMAPNDAKSGDRQLNYRVANMEIGTGILRILEETCARKRR